jgi:serine-type D-Ala-D-Ala endopeptidase (penicillin-binding protein 7)
MFRFMKKIALGALASLLWLPLLGSSTEAAAKSAPTSSTKGKSAQVAKHQAGRAVAAKPLASATGRKASKRLSAAASRKAKLRAAPPRPSMGQLTGLHLIADPLELKSAVALVIDQDTNEVLLSKNPQAVLPIASITKLMTAVVVADAKLPMDEMLDVSAIDPADTGKTSRSRLSVGSRLPRGELMHLALMASENRAAHALGRHHPGGMQATELGMADTRYVEPTGLSSQNRSSARDLSVLVKAAMDYPQIRELSTSLDASVAVGAKQVQFRNTNGLVRDASWDIGLQKTGYISEAGRCVVMQASMAGRKLIMVLLDSAGKYSRIGDAERIRNWLVETKLAPAVVLPRI